MENREYYIQKHQSPDQIITPQQISEPTTLYFNNRKTQTPVREVMNEGIQYNQQDTSHLHAFKNRLRQRHSTD